MTTTTRYPVAILILALAGSPIACGGDPCLPTVNADTLIIPPAEDCMPAGSTGGTTGGTECMPVAGEDWGPCDVDGKCNNGAFICEWSNDNAANHCVPACMGVCQPDDSCAGNGAVCQSSGICSVPCDGDAVCAVGQACIEKPNGSFCMAPIG